MSDAYTAFADDTFLQLALKNANFIKHKLIDDVGCLMRCYKDKAYTNAFLDDYAFVIDAYIKLFSIKRLFYLVSTSVKIQFFRSSVVNFFSSEF